MMSPGKHEDLLHFVRGLGLGRDLNQTRASCWLGSSYHNIMVSRFESSNLYDTIEVTSSYFPGVVRIEPVRSSDRKISLDLGRITDSGFVLRCPETGQDSESCFSLERCHKCGHQSTCKDFFHSRQQSYGPYCFVVRLLCS